MNVTLDVPITIAPSHSYTLYRYKPMYTASLHLLFMHPKPFSPPANRGDFALTVVSLLKKSNFPLLEWGIICKL